MALGWLLREIGWSVVSSSLKSVGLAGATLLVLLSVAESLCDGAALSVIVGSTISTVKVVTVHMAGSFTNMMLPLDSGEFLKMAMLREQLGTTAAVSGVGVWNYLFKLTRPLVSSLAAVLAIGLGNRSDARVLSLVCIANACAFLPFVLIRWGVRHGGTTAILEFARRVPLLKNLSQSWFETTRAVDERLQNFWQLQRSAYLKSCLLQMAARLLGFLALYVTIKSLQLPYTLSDALLVYASMNVVDYLVAVLPAKLGPLEGSA
ncbi:MAG TPA: lysylphosphatidylglycerol synthase domain-containing protein, partial [Polyangiaceae bacterium]